MKLSMVIEITMMIQSVTIALLVMMINRIQTEILKRLLHQLENENLCLKDEVRRKDKVIKVLLENFSNRVPEHSNYITSKNTEVSIQTDQQTKNNIQSSTTSSTIIAKWHHSTILATAKENDKN